MSLGREMLHEIASDAGENPLGLLGLSPEVLSLNLSEDELYSVCRRFAKSLLAEVHEDRVFPTARTRYLQARFSGALMLLRDKAAFSRALVEFRGATSRTSSDRSRQKQEMVELRRMLDEAVEELHAKDRAVLQHKTKAAERLRLTLADIESENRRLVRERKTQQQERSLAMRSVKHQLKSRREALEKKEDMANRRREALKEERNMASRRRARLLARIGKVRVIAHKLEEMRRQMKGQGTRPRARGERKKR